MVFFNIIVAVDQKGGIGKKGALPWHLPQDLKHFRDITCFTKNPDKKNAVIMGRKTWESIPSKFKPLPQRLNCVLSRNSSLVLPENVFKARGLTEVLQRLGNDYEDILENVFIIGGAQVYQEALQHTACQKIYLTQIEKDFLCDTFFPADLKTYHLIKESSFTTVEGIRLSFREYLRP